jgi:hypothetical protein
LCRAAKPPAATPDRPREGAGRGLNGQAPRLTKVTLTSEAVPELSGSGDGAKLITPLPLQGTVTEVGIAAFTP